eukprot:SAG31_NODE_207_length_20316_cov_20.465400_8_plen_156_part_00
MMQLPPPRNESKNNILGIDSGTVHVQRAQAKKRKNRGRGDPRITVQRRPFGSRDFYGPRYSPPKPCRLALQIDSTGARSCRGCSSLAAGRCLPCLCGHAATRKRVVPLPPPHCLPVATPPPAATPLGGSVWRRDCGADSAAGGAFAPSPPRASWA